MEKDPEPYQGNENIPREVPLYGDINFDTYKSGYLLRRIKNACGAFMACRMPFALVIIDIDRLGRFNDLRGADEGDRLLNRFSGMLKTLLHKGELLSSYGGDSFAIILKDITWKDCMCRAEEMRREFLERFRDEPGALTISIGAAFFPSAVNDPLELVAEAHVALRSSQRRGGDCVTIFPASPPTIPPGQASYVNPPTEPPALFPGYEEQLPDPEISLSDDM